jgi:hypothetical protein
MAGKVKRVLSAVGEALEGMADYNAQIRDMTWELLKRDRTLDAEQAERIARILVNQAEVTWK